MKKINEAESNEQNNEQTIADKIPGMRPGATVRNTAMVLGAITIASVFSPAIAIVSALVFTVIVGKGKYGVGEAFSILPGIGSEGGKLPAFATFFYMFLTVFMIAGMIGGGLGLAAWESSDDNDAEAEADIAEAEEEMHDVTVYVMDADGDAVSGADVEFVHSSGIFSTDSEHAQTDADGVATFETEHDNTVEVSAEASGYENVETSVTVTDTEEITLTLEAEPEQEPESEPVESEPEAPEETDEAALETDDGHSDEELMNLMETAMADHVVTSFVTTDNGVTTIEITSTASTEKELGGQIGAAGGAYAGAVNEGLDSDSVVIEFYAVDGTYAGSTESTAELAQSWYDSDDRDNHEYVADLLVNFEAAG